jgi:hypothetical protein
MAIPSNAELRYGAAVECNGNSITLLGRAGLTRRHQRL